MRHCPSFSIMCVIKITALQDKGVSGSDLEAMFIFVSKKVYILFINKTVCWAYAVFNGGLWIQPCCGTLRILLSYFTVKDDQNMHNCKSYHQRSSQILGHCGQKLGHWWGMQSTGNNHYLSLHSQCLKTSSDQSCFHTGTSEMSG